MLTMGHVVLELIGIFLERARDVAEAALMAVLVAIQGNLAGRTVRALRGSFLVPRAAERVEDSYLAVIGYRARWQVRRLRKLFTG